MAQRAVLLVRVSTDRQSYDEQEKQLYQMAVNDGYSDDNIIAIAEKESGIKLSEEQRKGLNRLKEVIATEDVAVVYAWEISRIARKKKVLFSILDLLISKKIQLKISEPRIELLNVDGSINEAGEMVFTLFAQMAESEMRNKKARFQRSKKANTEQGRYNGGRVHYGYTVDNGKIVVNDDEAEVVRLIYSLYASGEYSISTIANELNSRGIRMRGKAISDHFIANMLHTTAFIGYTVHNGNKRTYERIISDDLYNEVHQVMKGNYKGDITKKSKHINLAAKLIVCPECGRHWFATNRSYTCIGHRKYGCSNTESIAVEWVDIAAWSVAKACEMDYIYNFTETKADEARKQIEVNNQKIATLNDKISKVDERKKRIATAYINLLITEEEQKRHTAQIKQDIAEYNKQIVSLQEENDKLAHLADFNEEGTLIRLGRLPVSGINENAEEAYQITHKHIKTITVENFEYQNKKQKLITITTVMGDVKRFLYVAKSKAQIQGRTIKLFEMKGDETVPLVADKDFVPPCQ